jgi:hypothetical protein
MATYILTKNADLTEIEVKNAEFMALSTHSPYGHNQFLIELMVVGFVREDRTEGFFQRQSHGEMILRSFKAGNYTVKLVVE